MNEEKIKFRPRGILKYYVLKSLEERPLHGYEILKSVKSISGFWTPSPGTLYPLLKMMLKDELVRMHREGRRNVYQITRKGRKELDKLEQTKSQVRTSLATMLSELTEIPSKTWEEILTRRKWKFLALLFSIEKAGMKTEMKEITELIIKAVTEGKRAEVNEILEETKSKLAKLVK